MRFGSSRDVIAEEVLMKPVTENVESVICDETLLLKFCEYNRGEFDMPLL
jgi:hypothetical protein